MKLILASGSPRRKELLGKIIDNFEIIPAQNEEKSNEVLPYQYVAELAYNKASEVWANNRESVVLGCDTIVVFDNKILGKPHSKTEAQTMLSNLSGNTHQVLTGVCLITEQRKINFVATTEVTFRNLSASDIDKYIATGSCFDKAGSYGIQDSDFVSSIKGEYDNVMGLPTLELSKVLKELGFTLKK